MKSIAFKDWPVAVAVLCLAVARADSEASATQDGLRLTLRFVHQGEGATDKPRVVCELENLTDSPAPYESRGANCGFSFRLITRGGEVIHPTEAWSDLHMPDENGLGFTSHPRLYRERKLVYEQGLEEIFGVDWGRGMAFEAEWHPGASTGPEPYTRGVGLKARVPFQESEKEPVVLPDPPDGVSTEEGNGRTSEGAEENVEGGSEKGGRIAREDFGNPSETVASGDVKMFLLLALALAAMIAFLLIWIPRRTK